MTSRTLLACSASALSALFAAGCLVGPDYRVPETSTPAQWTSLATKPTGPAATQVSMLTDSAANSILWWQVFDDHTLDRLIREAVSGNLDLIQAYTRIRQSRASRAIANGGLYPDVNLNGSYRRSGRGDDNGANSGGPHDAYSAGLGASWEIDLFGGIRRDVEAANAEYIASIADFQDIRVSLVSDIAVAYFSLRAAQQRLVISERNLGLQRQSLELTRKRFKNGVVSGLDVANAESQVYSTEAQIPSLQASAKQSIYDIALLLGREPSSLIDVLSPGEPIPGIPPIVPAGLPAELLRRRPDIRRAEARLHAATARIGVAESDLFPRVSLTGSFGPDASRPVRLLNWSSNFWSIGPTLSWNVFDGGRLRAAVDLAEAREQEAYAGYQKAVLTALRDAERALTAYDYEQRRRVALRAAAVSSRKAVDIARKLYDNGQTDFVNVLTTQRDLLQNEDALAQADAQVAANLATLYRALGGGWEDAMPGVPGPAATHPVPSSPLPPATGPVSLEQSAVPAEAGSGEASSRPVTAPMIPAMSTTRPRSNEGSTRPTTEPSGAMTQP